MIRALQEKNRDLLESNNGKPRLEASDTSIPTIKSNGILDKVLNVARKNKNSFEKMWSKD